MEENEPIQAEPSATEDLMREHGIISRILLIYENIIMKINEGIKFDLMILQRIGLLIRKFVEEYHEEALEEKYIFPPLIKRGLHIEIINELIRQHRLSRKITDKIMIIVKSGSQNYQSMQKLARLMKGFVYMYRAHETREDTVVFNEFRKITPKKELDELSELFEETEHKMFSEGYDGILKQVIDAEKELGIYDLKNYSIEEKNVYILTINQL